ncbi:uncharacterized protein LOC110675181 [Aedes aegypti]|uniref:CCHC-type domain-containing protein n=1 Tax=Aedes aegypti TaxID=7159 RepID=A0A6I8TPN8_AEDAE|nr:uncharacterized protein LOC110675181 [Aedes aegypti]
MLSRNQNFTDLVDKVREIEAIKLNEDFVRKKYEKSEQALVATVGASFPKGPSRKFDYKPQRVSQNYGGRSFRGGFRAQRTGQIYAGSSPSFRSTRGEKCWRCHSPYHGGNDCSHKDKRCNYCGILGHIQRACRSHRHMSGIKRPTDLMEDAPQSRKIAAIEEVKDDAESDQTTHLKPERAIRQIANAPHVNTIPISNREETRQKSVRIAIETANILDNKSGLLKSSKNASNSTAENDLNAQNSRNEQNHTEPTKTETSVLSTVFSHSIKLSTYWRR